MVEQVKQPEASERALVHVLEVDEEQERTHMNEIIMKFDDDEQYLLNEIKDLKQQVRALPSS